MITDHLTEYLRGDTMSAAAAVVGAVCVTFLVAMCASCRKKEENEGDEDLNEVTVYDSNLAAVPVSLCLHPEAS